MIKAIVFDLDGTLIDSTDAIVESFFHTFDAMGEPPPPRQAVVDSIGYTLENQFRLFTDRDLEEFLRIYRAYYATIACEKTSLLPGAAESLWRLSDAGLRFGFATSKKREYAEIILDHLGILRYFEVRVGPYDVEHPKPNPEALLKTLDALGVGPDEAFFVGDTDFDVLAARAAEVRCLCVTTGYDSREKLMSLEPERVFDNLPELTDYILAHQE